jgi:hypothetical protein
VSRLSQPGAEPLHPAETAGTLSSIRRITRFASFKLTQIKNKHQNDAKLDRI